MTTTVSYVDGGVTKTPATTPTFTTGKKGNIECVGLNPPSSGDGPGVNNPADVYHAENCSEVSSDSCMAKCARRKFHEPMPPYSSIGQGSGINCHGWNGEVLSDCKAECRGK
jgi:hypothetical protein